MSWTPGAEAERLAEVEAVRQSPSRSDKNEGRPLELISHSGAKSLTSKGESLVAGNVTGGGGKATKKRPNGIVLSSTTT